MNIRIIACLLVTLCATAQDFPFDNAFEFIVAADSDFKGTGLKTLALGKINETDRYMEISRLPGYSPPNEKREKSVDAVKSFIKKNIIGASVPAVATSVEDGLIELVSYSFQTKESDYFFTIAYLPSDTIIQLTQTDRAPNQSR